MEFIKGFEEVVRVFGRWPSFHDAEVLALALERRRHQDPSILAVLHVWESTGEVGEDGYFKLVNQSRVTLRFHECSEVCLNGQDFNHQNVIFELRLALDNEQEHPVKVEFEPCYGVAGAFRCGAAEVIEVAPFEVGGDVELLVTPMRD